MVLSFVQKLKKAVLARKDANAQQTSENFIRDIMKKMDFNKTLKGRPMERPARPDAGIHSRRAAQLVKVGDKSKQPAVASLRSLRGMSNSNADNALLLVLSHGDAMERKRALDVVSEALLRAREG